MSLKFSKTTADALNWSEAMLLIRRLANDKNWQMSLLISVGCFTGLRVSDLLSLRWHQLLSSDELTITEKKTKKSRTIRLNAQLKAHIKECYDHINPTGLNAPILVSQKGTVFSVQRINVLLKEIKKRYNLHIENFSSHSLRKTFGRRVVENNQENVEIAILRLAELFNHSSVAITKRYLGIRQQELMSVYDSLTF